MTLRETLLALGLPAPSAEPPPHPTSPTDEINEVLRSWFGHDVDIVNVDHMLDVHRVLELWRLELERRLAQHGSKLLRSVEDVRLSSTIIRQKCKHLLVDVDKERSELTCRTCKERINAIWWLARHTDNVEKSEAWRRHLEIDRKKLTDEIDVLKKERAKHASAVRRRSKRT